VSFFTGQAGELEHSRERIRLRRILFELAPRASSEFESLAWVTPVGCPFLLAKPESRSTLVKEFGSAEFFLNSRRARGRSSNLSKERTPAGLLLLLGNGPKLKSRKDPAAEDLFVKILIAFFECLVYNVTIRYTERKLKYVR
jgi:hypothetical protein